MIGVTQNRKAGTVKWCGRIFAEMEIPIFITASWAFMAQVLFAAEIIPDRKHCPWRKAGVCSRHRLFQIIGGNYHDTCIEKQCGPEKSGGTEKTADRYGAVAPSVGRNEYISYRPDRGYHRSR